MATVQIVEFVDSLHGVEFPADKQDLIDQARWNRASRAVITIIKSLPDDDYDSIDEVFGALDIH